RAGSPGIDSDGVGEDLTRRFRRLCPRGTIYTTDAPPPAWLDALPNGDKRRILSDALAFARDFRPASQRSFYDVTVLAADGSVRIIFVQDARTDHRRRARWRALVRDANVALASAAFGRGKDHAGRATYSEINIGGSAGGQKTPDADPARSKRAFG